MTRLLQDILREPDELLSALAYSLGPGRAALDRAAALARQARHIIITGIGSSWHAGMAMQALFDAAAFPARLIDASELLHFAALPPDTTLLVLSRSGQSAEIVRLIDTARAAGARLVAVTNTPGSPLAAAADETLLLSMGFDHQVSVGMYSGLALVGGLLAAQAAGGILDDLAGALRRALDGLSERLPAWQHAVEASPWFAADAPAYFLARGGSLASCHEARLLWEEAAKAPASALMTGGFRHGPQEIVAPGLRLGLWLDGAAQRENDLALARDARSYGASLMLIGQRLGAAGVDGAADLAFDLPEIPPAWQFLVDIAPAQLAAERLSRLRGADCDAFRICPYIITTEGGLM